MNDAIDLYVVIGKNLCRYIIESEELDIITDYIDEFIRKFQYEESFIMDLEVKYSYVNGLMIFSPNARIKRSAITIPSRAIDAIWMEVQVNKVNE